MSDKSKKTQKDTEEKEQVTPEMQMAGVLNTHKGHHFNDVESVYYKSSLGSLALDKELGGIGPGVHRFTGRSEAGKTSELLEAMDNFLKVPKRRGWLAKAEGRLSPEMMARSPVKFVFDPLQWKEGTCFVLESNIYDVVIDSLRKLVFNNPSKMQYFFGIDSVDALLCKQDVDKGAEEAAMVAGGATISGLLLKKMNLALIKHGHIAVFVSQFRSSGPPPKNAAPVKKVANASGGYALEHYPDSVFEFLSPRKDDLILKSGNPKDVPHPKDNPILGRWARVKIWKSANEKSDYTLTYPIKYGRKKTSSIWIEKEVVDYLVAFDYFIQKGSWFSFNRDIQLIKDAFEKFKDIPEKIQGIDAIYAYMESRPDLCSFFYEYFKSILGQ